MMKNTEIRIFTVGHSNRDLESFIALLKGHGIRALADVRKLPGSKRHPHFNSAPLAATLKAEGIEYIHLPGLGGLRKGRPDSPNGGWENTSFRAYADYMLTEEFEENLQALLRLAEKSHTAIMCAEALPWQCHRSLIADALVARGVEVRHIMTPQRADLHTLRDFARVEGGRLTYPPRMKTLL